MIKLPDKTIGYSQPNVSDRYGNIFYTENINFDKKGYICLSPRAVSIANSLTDTDFNITSAIGRLASDFYIATLENPYKATISEVAVSITKDTDNGGSANAPSLGFDSHGTWWQNLWFVTTETGLFSKEPGTGYWTDHSVSLTTGLTHNIEVFKNAPGAPLCIGNGNAVVQISTSYSTSGLAQLALPANCEVTTLAYNNNLMGIATKPSDSASGQNGEAYFFTWDASSVNPTSAYGVGSDVIVALAPYKSTWVLLTRVGELLLFNGGGFTLLAQLPVKSIDLSWGDSTNREAYGDIMRVKGDKIYFQINNRVNYYGKHGQIYIPHSPGGILCYDPTVGIHHRYSPSTSQANLITVTSANISTTLNNFTKSSGTLYTTGNPIKYVYDGGTPIGGLMAGKVYYIITDNATVFRLALTKEDADAGNAIDITSTGASNNYFLALQEVDFGATRMERTGGIGFTAQKNNVLGELVFGGEYIAPSTGSNYEYFNFISEGFENRGCFVTSRFLSSEIEDTFTKVWIKYSPLNTNDKIIVKEKSKQALGLPIAMPTYGSNCTWTATDTFTTIADLSDVQTYLNASSNNECEVKIISGSGAGSYAKITSLTYNAGTYTVVLGEDITGVTVGYYSDVVIDNFKVIGEITSTDIDGYKGFNLSAPSKEVSIKVELRGSNVTIEETIIVNSTFKPTK